MRFDRRFGMVVSISLAWAAIVAGLFYRLASGAGPKTRAESQKQVVVAAKALPVGATIDRDSIRSRALPESMMPSGAFTRLDEVLGRPVISPIQADEPIVEARIAVKGSGMGLAPLIPPGMRAISVRVNDVVGVSGFVLPGMRVDVLVTGRPPNQAETITRTVLQNIAVLSAGQTTQTDSKSQSIIAPVVTLLVNPDDAEALTLANNEGHIQLVLRNSADHGVSSTRGRQLHQIFGIPQPEAAAASTRTPPVRATKERPRAGPAAAVTPAPEQIVIIRGKSKTVEVFEREGSAR